MSDWTWADENGDPLTRVPELDAVTAGWEPWMAKLADDIEARRPERIIVAMPRQHREAPDLRCGRPGCTLKAYNQEPDGRGGWAFVCRKHDYS